MHAFILDPAFHTPSLVCARSPFLLTTSTSGTSLYDPPLTASPPSLAVCAIASKFYPGRPELYTRLTELARKLAFEVPAQGYKSVEIVQAYLLLTLWGSGPAERFEFDRTWLLLGMALRMATDLNLHKRVRAGALAQETADAKAHGPEVRNRERTWMIAFCLDRSISAQMGKPYTIQEE
jgi:hypothetical protein